jgi:hypothetical protein
MTAELHLAEDALTLHLFLQRLEGLIDIVVANENLHACSFVGGADGFWVEKPGKAGPWSRAALAEVGLRVHNCPFAGAFVEFGR